MKYIQMAAMSFLALTCVTSAQKGVAHAGDNAQNNLKQALSEKFPDINIESISPSVLPGIYEVVTATEIAYVDASGKHMIIGQIMDTSSKENLTESRWNELNKVDFNKLPFDKAIKIIKGDGSRKMAVFADPFCPYCKELEANLQNIDNLTLYVFLYPLEGIHPGASEAARDIWCAPDRAVAWTAWMVTAKAPLESDCSDKPLESLAKLGEQLKINSTPTLFFSDGSRVPGSMASEALEKRLMARKLKN